METGFKFVNYYSVALNKYSNPRTNQNEHPSSSTRFILKWKHNPRFIISLHLVTDIDFQVLGLRISINQDFRNTQISFL